MPKTNRKPKARAGSLERLVRRLYPSINAGQEVPLDWRKLDYKMACCDCNLVHRLRFTVRGKTLIIQGWRDNRSTAQLRRRRAKTPNEKGQR
jgi:hypothetical protein